MTRQSKRIVKSTAMLVMVLGIARRSYSWKMPGAKPAPKSKVDDGPGNEPNSAAETVRRELAIQPERPPSVAAFQHGVRALRLLYASVSLVSEFIRSSTPGCSPSNCW